MTKATLNHFKSWWQREVIDKGRSLEGKKHLLAEIESDEDPSVYDITDENNSYEEDCPEEYRDEIVAWLREEYL